MPVKKIVDFIKNLNKGGVLLSANENGKDSLSEMSLNFMELEPGGEIRPHYHNRTETYIFLTGRAKVMAGDDICEVTTGDVAIAPAGTPHAIKVIGSEKLRFYAVNVPPASSCPMIDAPEEVLWKWKKK